MLLKISTSSDPQNTADPWTPPQRGSGTHQRADFHSINTCTVFDPWLQRAMTHGELGHPRIWVVTGGRGWGGLVQEPNLCRPRGTHKFWRNQKLYADFHPGGDRHPLCPTRCWRINCKAPSEFTAEHAPPHEQPSLLGQPSPWKTAERAWNPDCRTAGREFAADRLPLGTRRRPESGNWHFKAIIWRTNELNQITGMTYTCITKTFLLCLKLLSSFSKMACEKCFSIICKPFCPCIINVIFVRI